MDRGHELESARKKIPYKPSTGKSQLPGFATVGDVPVVALPPLSCRWVDLSSELGKKLPAGVVRCIERQGLLGCGRGLCGFAGGGIRLGQAVVDVGGGWALLDRGQERAGCLLLAAEVHQCLTLHDEDVLRCLAGWVGV